MGVLQANTPISQVQCFQWRHMGALSGPLAWLPTPPNGPHPTLGLPALSLATVHETPLRYTTHGTELIPSLPAPTGSYTCLHLGTEQRRRAGSGCWFPDRSQSPLSCSDFLSPLMASQRGTGWNLCATRRGGLSSSASSAKSGCRVRRKDCPFLPHLSLCSSTTGRRVGLGLGSKGFTTDPGN